MNNKTISLPVELVDKAVNGHVQEQGHALNEIRELLTSFLSNQSAPALIETLRANGDRIAMEATIAQQAQRIADLEAAKGQGEPVAWMYRREGGECLGQLVQMESDNLRDVMEGKVVEGLRLLWPRDDYTDWKPLYADQPAPVAVDDCDKVLMGRHEAWKAGEANGVASLVMPERQQVDPYVYDQGGNARIEGWNACLDEVTRLNQEPKL